MVNRVVVIGPPGTGKTEYIKRQVTRAVEKHGRNRVVIMSLTRSSARVAAGRIDLPETAIGTLHSFAYRALSSPALAEVNVSDWNNRFPQWRLPGLGGKAKLENSADEFIASDDKGEIALFNRLNILRARQVSSDHFHGDIADFYETWTQWKVENDYLDFTDLLETALHEIPYCPGNPAVIFVDEAQDFSALEMSLISSWASNTETLVTVGDRLQALFTWRGADQFKALPDDESNIVLGKSYRCPDTIVGYATNFISKSSEYRNEKYTGNGSKGTVKKLNFGLNDVDATLGYVQQILEKTEGESVMVLASCSYMLQGFIKQLRLHGVPFHNPYRLNNGAWNPLTASGTTALDRIKAFMKLKQHKEVWTAKDIKIFVEHLSKDLFIHGGKKRLSTMAEDWRSEKIAIELNQCIKTTDILEKLLNCDLTFFIENIISSKKDSYLFPASIIERKGLQALDNPPRVIIGTIHSVKGGEADNVLISPDISYSAYYSDSQGGFVNSYRLFYVALTRAKKRVFLLRNSTNLFMGI